MEKKQLNEMFDNLLHIGNKINYWDPKMKKYIYGSINGIHVINLVITQEKIEEAKTVLTELHTSGKKILVVGTKLQARDVVEKIVKDSGHYYVTEKWVPGLLTNFKTIKRRIATYIQLSKDMERGAFDMLTKKEKASKMLELEKLEKAYRGVKDMKRIPEVIFVVDGVYEDQAVREANILSLKSFAIISTNGDDTVVDYSIPANTNAVKSIEYVMNELKSAISGKVVAQPQGPNRTKIEATNTSKFKKIEDKKISGEKKTLTAKKTEETKKVETKAKEVKFEEIVKEEKKSVTKAKTTKAKEIKEKEIKEEEGVVKEKATKKEVEETTNKKATKEEEK